jgi:predicted permease
MVAMIADFRYAIRLLRGAPGFSAVAVLVVALGIGANAAVFTLIDALYFKTLPIAGSSRLVRLYAHRPGGGFQAGFSGAEYETLRARMQTLSPLAAETSIAQLHVLSRGSIHELRGDFVSSDYFQALDLEPRRGRFFRAEDAAIGGRDLVAVISDELCQQLHSRCEDALGAVLHVNALTVTIIGVTPRGFHGDDTSQNADLWLPQSLLDPAGFGCPAGVECALIDEFVGRLRHGETLRSAQAEAAATIEWSRAPDEHRTTRREIVADRVAGADRDARGTLVGQMQLLAALTITLLCVACANLAGLLLARGLTRRREIALRLSIGATRQRIVRQLLTEGLLLSGIGGAAGFLLSTWAVAQLAGFYSLNSEGFLHNYDFQPDTRVLLYVIAVAVLTGLVTAILPALQSSRQDLSTALKEGRAGDASPPGRRLRQGLVVAQVALSLALIVCTLLLSKSERTLIRGTHFDPSGVAVLRVRPELVPFAPERAEAFARDLAQRLRATPGVQSVGMMIGGEGLVWMWEDGHEVPVRATGADVQPITIKVQDVDSGFFDTLHIPVLSGRVFTDSDRAGAQPVAVVNETFARHFWPATAEGVIHVQGRQYQVVGVVADIQPATTTTEAAPHLYLSFWQTSPAEKGDVRIAVRVAGSPAAALPRLRAAIRALDPAVPLGEDMPMLEQIALEYSPVLLAEHVTSACGVLALLLSGIGLYSVLALAMRSRTREIGIRIAIGAKPREIARQFMRDALTLGAVGITIGLVAAWVAMRLIAAWLYGVAAWDATAFAMAAGAVLLTAIAAGYLPARRAACVDPIIALRAD